MTIWRFQIGDQRFKRARVAQLPQRMQDRPPGNGHLPATFERLDERLDHPWVKFPGLRDVPRRAHPHKLILILQKAQRFVEDGLIAMHAQPVQGRLPAVNVRLLKHYIPQRQHHPPTFPLAEQLSKPKGRRPPHLRVVVVERCE